MSSLNIQLPASNRSKSTGKVSVGTSSLAPRKKMPFRGASRSTSEAPAPKRVHQEEMRVTGGTWMPVVPIPDIVEVPPPPKERILLPEVKVMDLNFQVQDISDALIEAMLNLPPRFFLVFHALYESFFDKHWASATRSFLVDRQCKQISL